MGPLCEATTNVIGLRSKMLTRAVWILIVVLLATAPASALKPAEIVVVVNRTVDESVALNSRELRKGSIENNDKFV